MENHQILKENIYKEEKSENIRLLTVNSASANELSRNLNSRGICLFDIVIQKYIFKF